MLTKLAHPFVVLCGVLVAGCGNSGGAFTGGSGGQGGTGGSTATAGSGGSTSTGGATTGGTGGSTTTSGTVTDCAGLGDACTNCLAEQCTALYCACYADPACGSLVQCTQGCEPGDFACTQSCLSNDPSATSEAAQLIECAATECGPSCPDTAVEDPCQSCLYQKCWSEMYTCYQNEECAMLVQCHKSCPPWDLVCMNSCNQAFPNGVYDAYAMYNCVGRECASECSR